MKILHWRRVLLLFVVMINCCLIAACGNDSTTVSASKVSLSGDWTGVHSVAGAATPHQITGTIRHETGAEAVSGSVTINDESFDLTGTIKNRDIELTLASPVATIKWSGTYIDGRIKGTYTRTAKAAANSAADVASATGTFDLVNFLDIQGNIVMGPWLLYAQDNASGLARMTVRIGLDSSGDSVTATLTGTDPTTGSTINYGAFTMSNYLEAEGVNMYEHTFEKLPSNSLFSYVIEVTDSKKAKYSVNATFRTPPSRADIDSGKVTSQVFFGMGDNRREYTSASDYLPMVEQNMMQYGGIMSTHEGGKNYVDAVAQSCIIHCGDAVSFGKNISAFIGARYYGWKHEWLKSSNDTEKTDNYGHNFRYHTWMRASMPTFMSPGNHDGLKSSTDLLFSPKINKTDLDLYGKLMTNTNIPDEEHVTLPDGSNSFTYMVDYGGFRVISLNTYYSFVSADDSAIKQKLTKWVNEAYAKGPVILVLHPSPYGSANQKADINGNYDFSDMAALKTYLNNTFKGKKNLIVISGHVHMTARTVQNDINYYVLGTGGAADMNPGGAKDGKFDVAAFVKLSNYTGPTSYKGFVTDYQTVHDPDLANVCLDFAFGKFTVDYKNRKVTAVIIGAKDGDKGKIIDEHTWSY